MANTPTAGDDLLSGTDNRDIINGLAGNDDIFGFKGNDDLFGSSGNDELFGGDGDDFVSGGTGNDTVEGDGGFFNGNDTLLGGSGNDRLFGAGGNDVLTGGTGVDELNGGIGADRFVFLSTSHSGVGSGARDIIKGLFQLGQDDIDLTGIDAKTGIAGNQAFNFIGGSSFTAEGQVRTVFSGANTLVELNTDGDSLPEMQIEITGRLNLSGGEFLL